MLTIKDLNKSFIQGQKRIDVLNDLNISVVEGQTIAILGQSGSGKSTLLALLSGIDRPDSGSMIFEGEELTKLDEKSLTTLRSQKIGIIFQQFHLLPHLSALENVSLPLEILGRENIEAAKKALEEVGLGSRLNHYPSQLSGGEKQRVAIARSMVVEPDLLLADEPSGSLDEETGELVMDLIFNLVSENKKALILVTHNKELALRCQKVYHLEGGQLHLQSTGETL